MQGKRIFSIILAVMLLFTSTAVITSCAGPGDTASGGPDVENAGGQTDGEDPTEQLDENGEPVVMPSLNIDNTKLQDQLESDNTQQDSEGQQTADSSEGGNEAAGEPQASTEPVFSTERERKYIDVDWKPVSYENKVAAYKVKSGLSNVENAAQFGSFTDSQLKMLSDNGFVVIPARDEQLFYVYESNEYLKIPSFITVDSVLQTYHIFFDYSLRTLEYEYLLDDLEQLTDSMLKKSLTLYRKLQNAEVKAAALKNTAYFAVAQLALENELPADMPKEALDLAKAEFKLISDAAGFEASPIFKFKLDYSQYKPRGHYTRNHDFERFFIAMMWYGQVPFHLFKETEEKAVLAVPETLQALLMTYSLFINGGGTSDIDHWENIYDPTVFYVGSADDLTIYHYKDLIVKAFGEVPDPETFTDSARLEKLLEEAKKLPHPLIQAKWVEGLWGIDTPVGVQFRFMGQRYIPDSEILQKLCEPILRPLPKGLDVMGVLGSDRAYDILTNVYDEDAKWDKYTNEFSSMKEKFTMLEQETWRSNMYYGWLWVLKTFTEPFDAGYPSFMTNQAWQDKSLNTALASWAELRHDTILYGKQSGAECGGGEPPPVIKGYVEPNIGAYERLLWLTRYSRENLAARKILPADLESRMQNFEDLLQFLINCSVKELRNEELTQDEYDRIQFYGGTLEHLTSSFAESGMRWFEITSETDKNMAVIADVHTAAPGLYLEEGVGTASHIYAVVPIGGKLYLTRGAVFSYYEFVADMRLTDEEWQKLLKDDMQPPLPEWTDSFTDKEGAVKTVPVPVEPYESGC